MQDSSQYRYWAFISYSSKDKKPARRLHRVIENYGIPAQLVSHPTPSGHPAPKRFHPLFRDRDELPASSDLGAQIEDALRASRYLIVVCSRHAAQSRWVNKEIETFQNFGRRDRVLAMIVDGEPNTGDERECFPPALREHEPVAADARPQGDGGDGKTNAKLKLLAGMLGVSFDEIKHRDTQRRYRRIVVAFAVACLLILGMGALAWNANQQRLKAVKARHQAESILQYLLYDLRDKLAPVGRLDIVADVQKRVNAYYQELGVEPDDPNTLRNRASAYSNEGDRLLLEGDLVGAMKVYRESLAISQRLVKADPTNTVWQRDLGVDHKNLGFALITQGDSAGALKAYRELLAIRQRLARADPNNTVLQQDLSVSYNKVGYALITQGYLAEGMKAYRESLAISQRLAQADPNNTVLQRALCVSYENVGDALHYQGDLAGALKAHQESLVITQRLVQADPNNTGWQRDLSVSHNDVGSVLLAQGDFAGALKAFQETLAITQRLAQADPTNAMWQRDLSVSNNNVGDVLLAQGDLTGSMKAYRETLAITQRLAHADSTNTDWQQSLGVSYENVGNVLLAQGDLAEAIKAYQESLTIRQRLVQADSTNVGWQQDLNISYNKIGDALLAQGDSTGALKAYMESPAICQRLAQGDPNNAERQRELWISYRRVADICEKTNSSEAIVWWRKAYEQLSGMKQRGLFISAADEKVLLELRQKVEGATDANH